MRVLFVHQYFPGQFSSLAQWLLEGGHELVALYRGVTDGRSSAPIEGIRMIAYGGEISLERAKNPVLADNEQFIREAASASFRAMELKAEGWEPDLVYGHIGWGTGAFVREVFPGARYVKYCEWFHGSAEAEGDPDRSIEARLMTAIGNIPLLAEMAHADILITPTEWQRRQFPPPYRDLIEVVPDGIDLDFFSPDLSATFTLPDGRVLTSTDRIITYVARGADPYRGFEPFLRAVAILQERDPLLEAVILGDRTVYYGAGHGTEQHFETVTKSAGFDPARTHFPGRVSRELYRDLLRISAAHVYLTQPFVLSWSALEALATGCAFIGSDTPPVREFVENGVNGVLCAYDRPEEIAARIAEVRQGGSAVDGMRLAARRMISARWSLDVARKRHAEILDRLVSQSK